jgi:hypothetical protein
MQVFVKFSSENIKVFDVFEGATVNDVLKTFYNPKILNRLYVIFNGRIISEEERIEDKLQHGCTLHVCLSNVVRNVKN